MWTSSILLLAAVMMILAGLALMLDAGVHFIREVRAGVRSYRA